MASRSVMGPTSVADSWPDVERESSSLPLPSRLSAQATDAERKMSAAVDPVSTTLATSGADGVLAGEPAALACSSALDLELKDEDDEDDERLNGESGAAGPSSCPELWLKVGDTGGAAAETGAPDGGENRGAVGEGEPSSDATDRLGGEGYVGDGWHTAA